MTSFVYTWNSTFLATPADTELENLGAQRIRDTKGAVGERLAVDHDLTGTANDGQHLWVTLEPAPSNSFSLGATFSRVFGFVIAGITELFYQDSSAQVIQLTTNGKLNAAALSGALSGTTLTLSGSAQISGSLNVTGSQPLSSAGYFIQTAGPSSGSWSVAIAVNAGPGLNMSASGFFTASDRRMKSHIRDISREEAEEWVRSGRPRTYVMAGRPSAGFVAQEELDAGRHAVVSFVPEDDPTFAQGDGYAPDGHRLIREYGSMDIAYLTAALKGALDRIAELEAR